MTAIAVLMAETISEDTTVNCPRNHLGQPACHITAHPDHPDECFCIVCQRRFPRSLPAPLPPPLPPSPSPPIQEILLLILIVMLTLLLLNTRSNEPQPLSPSSPGYSPLIYLQESEPEIR